VQQLVHQPPGQVLQVRLFRLRHVRQLAERPIQLLLRQGVVVLVQAVDGRPQLALAVPEKEFLHLPRDDLLRGFHRPTALALGGEHHLLEIVEVVEVDVLKLADGRFDVARHGDVDEEDRAISPRLADPDLDFPYLLLLVSGGHCQLLEVRGVGDYQRLATTIDDAAGEAFDKAAKLLGLPYPGGPAIEELAKTGDPDAVPLPRPLVGSGEPHFSFAGLKSAVQRAVASGDFAPADIAASFQQAVVDCLVDRTRLALEKSDAPALVVAGGVAANQAIRSALADLADAKGRKFSVPPQWLCTDNAAMIAWAGAERFAAGDTDPLDVPARARWPLDESAEKVRGAGVKA